MLTDWNIRSEMSGAPTPGWAERDYYASRISFAVTYRATYDHEKTFLQDTEHAVLGVHLRRDGAQAPWEYQEGDHGIPVAEYSDRAMDTAPGWLPGGGRVLVVSVPGGDRNGFLPPRPAGWDRGSS